MILKRKKGKIEIELRPVYSVVTPEEGESILANASLTYAKVNGDAKANVSLGVGLVGGDAGFNFGGLVGDVGGDAKASVSLGFGIVDGDVGFNLGGLIGDVGGNAKANVSLVGGLVGGNAKANVSLGVGLVGGDAGFNFGPVAGLVGGNAKANVSLGVGGVKGNAGLNFGGIAGLVGGLKDYKVGDILPRLTKYLPKFIREIDLPAINLGVYTQTRKIQNGFALGLFNNITSQEDGDYVAVGLLNRIKNSKGKIRYLPLLAGRVSIDGIFTHSKLEEKVKE